MVRFALFWLTGGSILAAAGFFPTPSSAEFQELLRTNADDNAAAPTQPALPSDDPIFVFDAPQDDTSVAPFVIRPTPRPAAVDYATNDDPLSFERLVATAGDMISNVLEQRVSTEEAAPATTELVASVVNFGHNEAELDDLAEAKLEAMVSWLSANPDQMVTVYGHTDLTGGATYNQELGLTRAEMVADFLTDNGIAADRINAIMSFGESAPLIATEGRSRENRRVLVQTSQSL